MHTKSTCLNLLLAYITLVTAQVAYWGPKFHIGPARSEIVSMRCDFQPGYPPAKEEEFVAVWPGLWNPKSLQYDLVQAVTSLHKRDYMDKFCEARRGQWCTQAYILRSGRPETPSKGHAIDGNDMLTIEYERDIHGDGKWTQIVSSRKQGRLVKFTAGNRPATIMETGTEMQDEMAKKKKGTGDVQIYTNITIILREREMDFGRTFSTTSVNSVKVFAERPYTPDEGKTWIIRRVIIPAMNPGTAARPRHSGRRDDEEDNNHDRDRKRGSKVKKKRWRFRA